MHYRAIPNYLFVRLNTFCLSTCGVKKTYLLMTYLLGFNIVVCAWRLFLHVKVNIMLADCR